MRYFDGEIGPIEAMDIKAQLEDSREARAELASLALIRDVVRTDVNDRAASAGADRIADLVMHRITDAEAHEGSKARNNELARGPRLVASEGLRKGQASWAIAAAGALAVAAVLVLLAWRAIDYANQRTSRSSRAMEASDASVAEQLVATQIGLAADHEAEPGVSIDSVDFGAREGSIFYVPSEMGMTTVVWLNDDPAGGAQ